MTVDGWVESILLFLILAVLAIDYAENSSKVYRLKKNISRKLKERKQRKQRK